MENEIFVRTTGKELCFLALYAYDVAQPSLQDIVSFSWLKDVYAFDKEEGYLPAISISDRGVFRHGEMLLKGVLNQLALLDEELIPFLKRPMEKLLAVDKALLRLGAYLVIFEREMPAEAIFSLCAKFADLYGDGEAPSYIQGILGSLAKKWRNPPKDGK
ncbi:MAG: hypothetical protein N2314_01220 [Brevinematales bacterium]|nr:hypothetical protein [Brevinematales bacterium]